MQFKVGDRARVTYCDDTALVHREGTITEICHGWQCVVDFGERTDALGCGQLCVPWTAEQAQRTRENARLAGYQFINRNGHCMWWEETSGGGSGWHVSAPTDDDPEPVTRPMVDALDHELPPCRECGKAIRLGWIESTETVLRNKGLCFSCNLWTDRVGPAQRRGDRIGATLVVDGHDGHEFYTIGDGRGPKSGKGFAGRRFVVRWRDGTSTETDDLWAGGTVPAHFANRFPVTAELGQP